MNQRQSDMNTDFPYTIPIMESVKRDYERFRLETHQYKHKGLFTDGKHIFAVICDVHENDELLNSLNEKYRRQKSVVIPSVIIVGIELDHYFPIPTQSAYEKINLHGQTMTWSEFLNQLNMCIPREYHPFRPDFRYGKNTFTLTFKNELTLSEEEEIQLICESIGFQGYKYIFQYNADMNDYPGKIEFKTNESGNMQIVASGLIQK